MDVTTYEAKVKALEAGTPLPDMTPAESAASLHDMILAEDWRTPAERDRAQHLLVRLALLRLPRPPRTAVLMTDDHEGAAGQPPQAGWRWVRVVAFLALTVAVVGFAGTVFVALCSSVQNARQK
jgi:hypothetical protein